MAKLRGRALRKISTSSYDAAMRFWQQDESIPLMRRNMAGACPTEGAQAIVSACGGIGDFYGYAIDPERADNDAVNRRLFRVVPLGSHAENITQDPRHAGASGRFRSADDVVTMTEASANSRNPLPVQKCRAWVLNLACVHKPEATITRGLCRNGSCGSRGGIRV
jgi:hypothetical protein